MQINHQNIICQNVFDTRSRIRTQTQDTEISKNGGHGHSRRLGKFFNFFINVFILIHINYFIYLLYFLNNVLLLIYFLFLIDTYIYILNKINN